MSDELNFDRPSSYGAALGKVLAQIAQIGRDGAHQPIPEMCGSCAFREGSFPNQAAGTGLLALNCTLRIDKDRFACHHNLTEGDNPSRLCGGYLAALLVPFDTVKELVATVMPAIEALPATDPVREEFDRWYATVDPAAKVDAYHLAREWMKRPALGELAKDST